MVMPPGVIVTFPEFMLRNSSQLSHAPCVDAYLTGACLTLQYISLVIRRLYQNSSHSNL